jgi:hypothetical protein
VIDVERRSDFLIAHFPEADVEECRKAMIKVSTNLQHFIMEDFEVDQSRLFNIEAIRYHILD